MNYGELYELHELLFCEKEIRVIRKIRQNSCKKIIQLIILNSFFNEIN
jgi:hypothetical protein